MLKALRKKLGLKEAKQFKDQTRKYGDLSQITEHHLRRYKFAITKLPPKSRVLDAACGCGYGSHLIQMAGHEVTGVDIAQEAIDYANKNYPGPEYICTDAYNLSGRWDVLVSIETLEHLARPRDFLSAVKAPLLIASVPNENEYPFDADLFRGDEYPHQRHYTPNQFVDLLESSGYFVTGKFCQKDKLDNEVVKGTAGKFLVYVCESY